MCKIKIRKVIFRSGYSIENIDLRDRLNKYGGLFILGK